MLEREIDKGMVVMLKSGGPSMTVRALAGSQVYCEWFTEMHRRFGTFEVSTLVPIRSADPEHQGPQTL